MSKDTLNSHLTSLTELFSREKCLRLSCVILHDLDAEVKSNSIFSLIFLVILRSVCLKLEQYQSLELLVGQKNEILSGRSPCCLNIINNIFLKLLL